MIARIREIRRCRGLTLEEVARRCAPATTAQTIGRLETGARTLSVAWLGRIAKALDVDVQDLLESSGRAELKLLATVRPEGVIAVPQEAYLVAPVISSEQVAVKIAASIGDYRAGDELWCELLHPPEYAAALNRDVLVPRQGGRFVFGRLINRDQDMLHVLALHTGARQTVVQSPTWLAVAKRLVRSL